MRLRHRLWPGSHGVVVKLELILEAARPVRSGKMACGSRVARSQRGEEVITKSISDGLVSDNA